MRLLLECARIEPEPAAVRRAAGAITGWRCAGRRADLHRMGPLVASCLTKVCPELVEPQTLAWMKETFAGSLRCAFRLGAELVRAVAQLEGAGIAVAAFKGPAVAWTLYESPAMRQMSDLDLLVRPGDVGRAVEVLREGGVSAGL
jgi:hypothetical protein